MACHARGTPMFVGVWRPRSTPLDLYFSNQPAAQLAHKDPLVSDLLVKGGWWGLDALLKSSKGYEKTDLPAEWRAALVTGSPYDVSSALKLGLTYFKGGFVCA